MPAQNSDRALIVPVFIPHAGCPHRCAFCDQTAITGTPVTATAATVDAAVARWRPRSRDARRPLHIAFYGGNFLGLPETDAGALLDAAAGHVCAASGGGIRFSTRPDTITGHRLATLAGYPVHMVELGVQSLDDGVLEAARRGHDAHTALAAVRRLKRAGYRVGVQLMVGLPGDTAATACATARQVAALRPDAVRIYPTVVLTGSALARWTTAGRYRPWSLASAVATVAGMARIFGAAGIPVIRMGLHDDGLGASGAIVAGPHHPAFGHLVQCRLFRDTLLDELGRGPWRGGRVAVGVHPRSRSRLGGWRNATLAETAERFAVRIEITTDPGLAEDQLWVDHRHPVSVFFSRSAAPDRW